MKSLGEQPADEISNAKVGFLVLVARRPRLRLHSEVAGVADGFEGNGGFDGQFETAADADIPRLGDKGSDGSYVEVSGESDTLLPVELNVLLDHHLALPRSPFGQAMHVLRGNDQKLAKVESNLVQS